MAFAQAGASALPTAAAPKDEDGKALYHVIVAGETMYSIAKKYNLSPESLMAANGIKDASKIKQGQKLLIPAMHKVEKGETLYGIARAYGITLEELRRINKLSAQAVIKVGDSLTVAAKKPEQKVAPSLGPTPPLLPSPSAGPAIAPIPLAPPTMRTSAKAVDKKVSWPCSGEALYLEGKAQGVLIRSRLGEAEKAVAAGKVVAAGPFRGYGQMAIVMSRTGHLYVYAGNESLSVKVGDSVRSGQELGRVGIDAKEGAPIAFFMVYRGREAIDAAEAPRD
jgi:LysM repeat protein